MSVGRSANAAGAAIALLAVASVLLTPGPALASKDRAHGSGGSTFGPTIVAIGASCDGIASPVPQYSAATRKLHFGGKISCIGDPGTLTISAQVWAHEDGVWQEQGSVSNEGVGLELSTPPGVLNCFSRINTQWKEYISGSYDGLYQAGWTPIYTLPCG